MFTNLTGWHTLIIVGIIVLIFGAAKLPNLARSVGQSVKVLQTELKATSTEDSTSDSAPTAEHHSSVQ